MKRRVGLGLTLAVCAAVEAAEPASTAPAADASTTAPTPAANASKPMPANPASKPLDLSIRDVRNYMMPRELAEVLGAPDADKNTVVVEARRELLPMEFEEPVPGGLMAPFWAIANPLQSWRIFVPDLAHAPKDRPRDPEEKIPPPIFRWGP